MTAVILFLMPSEMYGQAPNLGTTANFVLFTGVGAITNGATPIYLTHLTGNLGSNSGAATGFGNVDGVLHSGNATTATALADLTIANTMLDTTTPTFHPSSSTLGGGDTLVPGVYAYGGAGTLNGNLYLDAGGNPNAVFIFQFPGLNTFDPTANSKVILINGAQACNVFWKVGGAFGSIAAGTNVTFRGTIVCNRAINLYSGDTLEGRALSTTGAITVSGTGGVVAFTPIGCGSAVLTGPAFPTLGATKTYALFSSNGAVTNAGVSHILGDVGAMTAAPTGFGTAIMTGAIHFADASATAASGDLSTLYNYLNALSYDIELLRPDLFGHNLVLTPHTYLLNAATDLTDTVILDAQGDVNAVFVFQIMGAFNALTGSKVKLINGTKAKNVFWKVTGATTVFTNSVFNGSIIGGGGASAIQLNTLTNFNGSAMTTNGAVTINNATITADVMPVAGPLTGDSTVCIGANDTLSGVDTGGVWSASNSHATVSTRGIVTGVTAGLDTIRYIVNNAFGSDTSVITIRVKPNPVAGPITGPLSVCIGSTITLSGADSAGIWSRSNANATISSSGVVTGVSAGIDTMTYIVTNTCGSNTASKAITINPAVSAGTIAGPSVVCTGNTITLTDAVTGGTWSATNTHASVLGGVVTGVSSGTDTVRYIVTGACGTDTATKIITINPSPNAGSISGPATVCAGSVITLTDAAAGGIWTASNTNATVVGGLVTGVTTGIDTIIYSVTNSCGTAIATKAITVNPLPNAGTITGASSVCTGTSTTLTDAAAGGTWSASNTHATVIGGVVTGITPGLDTIAYTVTNSCGTDIATKTVNVISTPNAGVITGASTVCVASSTTLSDAITGGTWSATNTTATVTGAGVVTGVSAGIDTIRYTVVTGCGADTATKIITVNPLPNAGTITGASSVCTGTSTTLTNAAAGGTWSASNTHATVIGGVVTGITPGLDTIAYTVTNSCGTDIATKTVTVIATPNAGVITGASTVCVASSTTLSDAITGGTWSATNANATVTGAGVVTGVSAGIDTIRYTVVTGCGADTATKIITVNPLPNAGTITGASSVCVASSITLTDASTGGTWSATNTNATVSGTGVVTGVAAGIDTIVYTVTNSCGTDVTSKTITINPLPNAGTISGPSNVCISSTVTLTDGISGGTWSVTNTNATVAGGIITGISAGIDTVKYAYTNTCGTDIATYEVKVNALPVLTSTITPAAICDSSVFAYTPVSDSTIATFAWTRAITSGISNAAGSRTGNISEPLFNTTNSPVSVLYNYVTSAHGCTTSQNIAVTVNPTPKLVGVLSGTACSGSSFTYAATSTVSGTTLTWTRAAVTSISPATGAGTGDVNETLTNGTTAAINVVYVYTLSANGCSFVQHVVVSVNPTPGNPVISISAPSAVCKGTMYQNFGTTAPAAGIQYHWSAINATVWATGSNGQNSIVSFPNTGTAYVVLSTNLLSFPCMSSTSYTVNVSTSVSSVPVVTYFQYHFVCTPNNEGSYQWGYDDLTTLDSTKLNGEINQDYLNVSPDFAHKAYWAMTNMNGCNQKTYYRIPAAIENVNAVEATIDVFPNPATATISVNINTISSDNILVEVRDMTGQKLSTVAAVNNTATVDVAAFAAGMYMVTCYKDGVTIGTTKFIKN